MENQLPISWNKIWIVAIILLILIFLAGIFILFFSFKKTAAPEKDSSPVTENKISNSPTTNVPSSAPTIISPSPVSWQKISTSDFEINYPPGYKIENGNLAGGGTSTSIYNDSAKILIEVSQDPANNAANIVNGFKSFGYFVNAAKMENLDVTEVSGSRLNVITEKGYIFDTNGKTFKIIFTYYLPAKNLAKEAEFDQIVSTFQIK